MEVYAEYSQQEVRKKEGSIILPRSIFPRRKMFHHLFVKKIKMGEDETKRKLKISHNLRKKTKPTN